MTEERLVVLVSQYGGLGVLALFAWALLRSFLKQQERLGNILNNHLTELLKRQEVSNAFLSQMVEQQKEFLTAWHRHMEDFRGLEEHLKDG